MFARIQNIPSFPLLGTELWMTSVCNCSALVTPLMLACIRNISFHSFLPLSPFFLSLTHKQILGLPRIVVHDTFLGWFFPFLQGIFVSLDLAPYKETQDHNAAIKSGFCSIFCWVCPMIFWGCMCVFLCLCLSASVLVTVDGRII